MFFVAVVLWFRLRFTMGLSSEDLDKIKKIFTDKFLQSIADKVANIIENNLVTKFDNKIKNHEEHITQLEAEVSLLKKSNRSMEAVIDQQEQASRNLNVRIFGVPLGNNEDVRVKVLHIFCDKMNLRIEDCHISKCYRIAAKKPNDKPPAILVNFVSDIQRSAVLRNCKLLKSTGIVVKEDLTKLRLRIMEEAVKKFTGRKVWSTNGRVFIRKCDGSVQRVDSVADLLKIPG